MNQEKILIFDSHAHYDDSSFDDDRNDLIRAMHDNNIVGIMNCGASLKGAFDSVELSNKYEFIYCAVGIHPENAYEYSDDVEEQFKNIAASSEKVKAIGEIGLDYYWEENPPKEVQKDIFIRQMKLAEELKLPVIIHDRDAHSDTLKIMKQFPNVSGVVHCFSGSKEFADECLRLGYYIGFTGVVTFKNSKKAVEVAKHIPIDRMVVETDAPYMAPVPNRGKRNQSTYIEYIIDKIAEVRDIDRLELSNQLIDNTKRLFNIK